MNFPELKENLTIVIADAPTLQGIRQRVQHLALRFAKILAGRNGRLLYIDEPGNIVTVFFSPEKPLCNLWRWMSGPKIEPETRICRFVPPAGLPFAYQSKFINAWNHAGYRLGLGRSFKKNDDPVVLIVCNVLGLGWLGKFGEDAVIYDCADEISEFRQAKINRGAVLKQERELIGRVDALVTTSKTLYESKSKFLKSGGKARLIRNAAEIEHFQKAFELRGSRPEDLFQLKKPIVGFYGFLAEWLDWPLIEKVVKDGKEFDWVFIGPTTRNLSDLEKLPNCLILGKKPYGLLPEYLANFACAHIPFDRTPLTVHVNPVKVYEYLAGGVPVVATHLPELEAFGDVCALTNDPDEYLEEIRKAVKSDSPEKRQARFERVKRETWDARVEEYCKLINELI
ncbi:MAG: glycosyltransferase [bacterium]|nr:glycosyltransferase [bacterium]